MAGRLPMGQKELLRGKVMELVKQKQKTLKTAAAELRVSYRQAKRIYKRYLQEGDSGLIHRNVGKESNRKTEEALRRRVTELYESKYPDFGPTFAAEKLEEPDGITVSVSTLRRILTDEGLWQRKRRSAEYRSRRDRRERFGELLQFDGSHHRWFENRGPRCCLITMIDDATNIRYSRFFEEETTFGVMTVLKEWIERFGVPESLYCDKKNAFVLSREPTDEEILKGILEPKSHFGKACDKLGIEVIPADSPQAKGRVERNHGVDQDRMVKELRLAGIKDIESANAFLRDVYLPKMNGKFSRLPVDDEDAHVSPGNANLDEILCLEYERVVSNDYVIRFEGRFFQILKSNRRLPRPKSKLTVKVKLDNSISIMWDNKKLLVKELKEIKKANLSFNAA